MATKSLILFILIVLQISCSNLRFLAVNSDNCAEYQYIDKNGKTYDQDCSGCKKVCKKCDKGYYLDDNYKCKKLPDYCE